MSSDLLPGRSFPLGAAVSAAGVHFCVFSKNCSAVELLLFERAEDAQPSRIIPLDPERNRTFYYWHVLVPGLQAGQLYGYRVHGPYAPEQGHYFDGTKVLLDPYARLVMYGENYSREAARRSGDNCAQALKGVVVDPEKYDWEGDQPLRRPFAGSIIYELHVRGFTRHPSSKLDPARRGTYAGLIEKIPYLQELGITTVELLPVQQFDEQHGTGRREYWGYNPLALFAPHRGYSSRRDMLGPLDEFRDLVKALHRAGLEVILDVVFNHTAEGGADGPTLSFRGLENRAYYIPAQGRAGHANYSGCGNTLNGNHSIVRRLIMDCLRYWVQVMHVDGFRFDLASVLARGETGQPLLNPPILWEIESDPVLAGSKLIAEAWDAAGLYQVGSFIGHRWAEWNGKFRDDVRRFVKGDNGMVSSLAARLLGSPELYREPGRDPHRSIHFITCHDGFTLHDLVSYNDKHNEANGENNQDGNSNNLSWNCGCEGPADDHAIHTLRQRQIKNFLTVLFVAQGTPMLLMGDELARSQSGNNNTYCQDNESNWLDWGLLDSYSGLHRFNQCLIALRRRQKMFQTRQYWSTTAAEAGYHIHWHGVVPSQPDWSDNSHTLAFTVTASDAAESLYVALNAFWEPLRFELPPLPPGQQWHRVADTALPAPLDISAPGAETPLAGSSYLVAARSALVLIAR